jgi:hypothetical protein
VKRACERVRKGSKEGWGAEGKRSVDKKGEAAEDPYIAELGPLRFEAVDLLEMVSPKKEKAEILVHKPCAVPSRGSS